VILVINALQRKLLALDDAVNGPAATQWESLNEALVILKHVSIVNSQLEMVLFPALARYYRESQRDDEVISVNPLRAEGVSLMLQAYSHDIVALRQISKQIQIEVASQRNNGVGGGGIGVKNATPTGSSPAVNAQAVTGNRMLAEIRTFVALQRAHYTKVERQLYPLVEQHIPRDAQQRLVRTILDVSPFLFAEQTLPWAIRNQCAPSITSDEDRAWIKLQQQQRVLAILRACLPGALYDQVMVMLRREIPVSTWSAIVGEDDGNLVRSPSSMLGDLSPDYTSDDNRVESTDDLSTAILHACEHDAASASSSPTTQSTLLAQIDEKEKASKGAASSVLFDLDAKSSCESKRDDSATKKDDSATVSTTSSAATAAAATAASASASVTTDSSATPVTTPAASATTTTMPATATPTATSSSSSSSSSSSASSSTNTTPVNITSVSNTPSKKDKTTRKRDKTSSSKGII
jgi:hypothetical protein